MKRYISKLEIAEKSDKMSDKYKIWSNEKAYFLTMTIVEWVDVFSSKNQKFALVNSLDYCIKNKDLEVYAYVLMSNHLHMICRSTGSNSLSAIIRDFKKFTSKSIVRIIEDEPEGRRKWMLDIFMDACKHFKRNQKYKVWQDGNQAKEINSIRFFYEKLEYIHNNPVKKLIVEKPEDYLFSSARSYAGLDVYLDVVCVGHKPLTEK